MVRFYNPFEDSHRFTASYEVPDVAGFQQMAVTGFLGTSDQRTDQDRFATATTGRSVDRSDVSANDFHIKGSAKRGVANARIELGVDVNGRYGLEALDITQASTRPAPSCARRGPCLSRTHGASTRDSICKPKPRSRHGRESPAAFAWTGSPHGTSAASLAIVPRPTPRAPGSARSRWGRSRRWASPRSVPGVRNPSLSDRYFRGPSGRGFITGNPDLQPETSLQLDFAARYTLARTQIAAYCTNTNQRFNRALPDANRLLLLSQPWAGPPSGIELEARTDVGRGYSLELSGQVSRGVALDDGAAWMTSRPRASQRWARKEFGTRGYAQCASRSLRRIRPGPSEVGAPGSTIVEVGGGWRVAPPLELRGTVRNLLNDTYYASPDPRWVCAPGAPRALPQWWSSSDQVRADVLPRSLAEPQNSTQTRQAGSSRVQRGCASDRRASFRSLARTATALSNRRCAAAVLARQT